VDQFPTGDLDQFPSGASKFRRQHVIGGYVVDFYCARLWLALEVDGSIHAQRREQDEQREADLAALGVHVLRMSNAEVLCALSAALERVRQRCASIAHDLGIVDRPG
jgi:very-short-patch-repair endonuclease